jgi:hypothetical protein
VAAVVGIERCGVQGPGICNGIIDLALELAALGDQDVAVRQERGGRADAEAELKTLQFEQLTFEQQLMDVYIAGREASFAHAKVEIPGSPEQFVKAEFGH